MQYKICFSITCHECPICLIDIFERIRLLAPNSCAVVSCGATSGEEFYQAVKHISSFYNNVYVNPAQHEAGWGDGRLVNLIMSNFQWAWKNIDFEYFWLEASNALIVNPNIEEFVSSFDIGATLTKVTPELKDWPWTEHVLSDPLINELCQKLNLDYPYGGQHEGLFAKKDLFKKIYDEIREFLPFDAHNYPREESFMQTVISTFYDQYRTTRAGCTMWINNETLEKVVNKDYEWMANNNTYSMKPIPRDPNNDVRVFLRERIYEN